jgi:uncharacterized protein
MTEPADRAPDSPVTVVRAFYQAINDHDAASIGALIDQNFSQDAALELPPSLPYGGRVESARRLRTMFTGMLTSSTRVGPDTIAVKDIIDGGDRVVAQLEFGWGARGAAEPVQPGALELWTFADGRVRELRAYYWEPAALPSG